MRLLEAVFQPHFPACLRESWECMWITELDSDWLISRTGLINIHECLDREHRSVGVFFFSFLTLFFFLPLFFIYFDLFSHFFFFPFSFFNPFLLFSYFLSFLLFIIPSFLLFSFFSIFFPSFIFLVFSSCGFFLPPFYSSFLLKKKLLSA